MEAALPFNISNPLIPLNLKLNELTSLNNFKAPLKIRNGALSSSSSKESLYKIGMISLPLISASATYFLTKYIEGLKIKDCQQGFAWRDEMIRTLIKEKNSLTLDLQKLRDKISNYSLALLACGGIIAAESFAIFKLWNRSNQTHQVPTTTPAPAASTLESTRETVPHNTLALNNQVNPKPAGVVKRVCREVLREVAPHLWNMSPWYISRLPNIAFIRSTISLTAQFTRPEFPNIPDESSLEFSVARFPTMCARLIESGDFLAHIPSGIKYQIGLCTTLIASSYAFSRGIRKLYSIKNDSTGDTSSKVSAFISGTLLTTLGALGMYSTIAKEWDLMSDTSSDTSKCNAVIFTSSDPIVQKSRLGKTIQKHCRAMTFVDPKSPEEFCKSLANAKENFSNEPIDVLSIQGHADTESLMLSEEYMFFGNEKEADCINKALSADGQVFLAGCNTATSRFEGDVTITEKLSNLLPGKEVTGFAADYYPYFTTTSFSNGRFQHENHVPFGSAVVKKT